MTATMTAMVRRAAMGRLWVRALPAPRRAAPSSGSGERVCVRRGASVGARAPAVALVGALLVASCADAPLEPRHAQVSAGDTAAPAPAAPPRASGPEGPPEYYPSVAVRDAQPDLAPLGPAGDGGLLVDGWRVTVDGQHFADDATDPPLLGGTRVPAAAGGGYFFWNGRGLYYSRTFLGVLEPLWSLPRPVSRVRFGRELALLVLSDGARVALTMPTRQPGALPVPGLVDLALLGDGRSVMVTEPDRTAVSAAAASGWRDVSAQVGAPSALLADEGEIWLESERGTGLRLERDGSLTEFDRIPAAIRRRQSRAPDPRWPLTDESPLERAVRRGVPVSRSMALVEAGGAVARIRIPSGELVEISRRALPADASCELAPVAEEIVAVCQTATASFVTHGLVGPKEPAIDRTFVGKGRFVAGVEGSLGYDGPCSRAPEEAATVCVRAPNGRWRDVPLASPGADGGAPSARPVDAGATGPLPVNGQALRRLVARWAPRADGSVVVVYGGASPGLWDSRTGAHVAWSTDAAPRALDALAWDNAPPAILADDFAVTADGGMVGYTRRLPVEIARDGTMAPSPWTFASLANAGRQALGRTSDGRLWQSADFGQRWVEIAPPPPAAKGARNVDLVACSRVGCDLRRWYRFGYSVSQPAPRELRSVPEPPRWPHEPLPRLVCEAVAAPERALAPRTLDRDGNPRDVLDLGAHAIAQPNTEDAELSIVSSTFAGNADMVPRAATELDPALLELESPEAGVALGRARTMRFYDPLSARPTIASARFNWRDVVRATAPLGYPDLGLLQGDGGLVFPLPEERSGAFSGLLLVDSGADIALLLRDRQPIRTLPIGPELEEHEVGGALRLPSDEIALLLRGDGCGARVLAWSGSGGRVVLEVPDRGAGLPCSADGDALAVAADGRVGLLRLPSGPAIPTRDDPPLLLLSGQPPARLAPWSSLLPADAPACAGPDAGARVLLLTAERWLELELPGHSPGGEPGDWMLAQLRWGASHVCLEAVELPAAVEPFPEGEIPTAVVARFSPKAEATLRGYALGAELHQSLRCAVAAGP